MATSDAHERLIQALREAFRSVPKAFESKRISVETFSTKAPSDYRDRMHQVLDQILEVSAQSPRRVATGRRYRDMGEYFEWKVAQQKAAQQEEDASAREPVEAALVAA